MTISVPLREAARPFRNLGDPLRSLEGAVTDIVRWRIQHRDMDYFEAVAFIHENLGCSYHEALRRAAEIARETQEQWT